MKKINSFLVFLKDKKNRKKTIIIAVVLAIILMLVFLSNSKDNLQTITVVKGEFKNQVSVSGKVTSSSSVDLGFKKGGRVEKIYYTLDSSNNRLFVKGGTIIAQIEAKEARKDLSDAEVELEDAKLSLRKVEMEKSEEKINNEVKKAYDDGFVTVSNAFLEILPIVDGLKDVLDQDVISPNTVNRVGKTATYYRNESEKLYYKADNTFSEYQKVFRNLTRDSSYNDIEMNLNKIYEVTKITADALKSTKNLVDYLSNEAEDDTSYLSLKNTLGQYINTTTGHLSLLSSAKTDIKEGRDLFANADIDIQSMKLNVRQKENNVEEARKILGDYYIRAPFDGLITKIEAKVGEIVSSDVTMVTMMNDGVFQIESFVPEINISLVKIGDMADVTLDAYGDSIVFLAKVFSIDPAETIHDGVSTYKVRLIFGNKDDRILSGMTANALITAFSKPDVIVLPKGVIYKKDSKSFVQVKKSKEIEEREIVTGEVSSLGQVEVVSGIKEGEIIILNPTVK